MKICLWKIIVNDDKTSFQGRTETDLDCFKCDGYIRCKQRTDSKFDSYLDYQIKMAREEGKKKRQLYSNEGDGRVAGNSNVPEGNHPPYFQPDTNHNQSKGGVKQ